MVFGEISSFTEIIEIKYGVNVVFVYLFEIFIEKIDLCRKWKFFLF